MAKAGGRGVAALLGALALLIGCTSGDDEATKVRLDIHAGDPARSSTPIAPPIGALAPGVYRTGTFEPAMRFTVDGRWQFATESACALGISPTDASGFDPAASVYAVNLSRACDPQQLDPPIADLVTNQEFTRSKPFRRDYLRWLTTVPFLTVDPERPTTFGGLRGRAESFTVGEVPQDRPCTADGRSCFNAIMIGADSRYLYFPIGSRAVVYDLTSDSAEVLVFVEVADAGASLLNMAASIRFEDSGR